MAPVHPLSPSEKQSALALCAYLDAHLSNTLELPLPGFRGAINIPLDIGEAGYELLQVKVGKLLEVYREVIIGEPPPVAPAVEAAQ